MRDAQDLITRARCCPYLTQIMVLQQCQKAFYVVFRGKKKDDQWLNSVDLFKKFLCGLTPCSFSRLYIHTRWLKEFLQLSKITAELIKKETGPQNAVK